MAESILAVVEKLANLLVEEGGLLKGVKGKVETLMKQLSLMQAVVNDADTKLSGNEAYNCWLLQIRHLGYQAVDVIETYRNYSESPGFLKFKFIRLHKVNREIDKVQSSLEGLFKSKDGFNITPSSNPEVDAANQRRLRTWREPPAILKEDDYIDLVEDTKELIAQLSSMDPRHSVVSIVGMAGLGKTTLANKLYNHSDLKFECKAFVSVSKEYRRKEVLYGILDGVVGASKIDHSDKEEEKDLIIKLHNFLKEKKYLVVLDDVWEKCDWYNLKEPEEWESVYGNSRWHIMNDEDRVSKIIFLSYNYLPFHLKLCFQHLSIFPEDFCIPKNKLIRLWVAERFLPQQGEDTEEGVAENCLYELINRTLVMVGMRTCRGRVKAISIHDVLRDFSLSKAKEGNFLETYSGKEVLSRSNESRRLAIHGRYNDYAFLEPHTPHLRSLHFFSEVKENIDFVKHAKLLNVLEVSAASDNQTRWSLDKLSQLRYLEFGGSSRNFNMAAVNGKWTKLQHWI